MGMMKAQYHDQIGITEDDFAAAEYYEEQARLARIKMQRAANDAAQTRRFVRGLDQQRRRDVNN